MRSELKLILVLIGVTLAAGCSGTARTREPAAAPAAAPQTLAAAAGAPATAPPQAPASAPGDVDKSLIRAGYSVMRRHDEVLYCRNEIITGQRIATRICLTAEQIQAEKQNVTKAKDLLNLPANRCLGPTCNQ